MLNIAICDDNKVMLDYICRQVEDKLKLHKLQFKITCFTNGELLLCANENEAFDVLFLDIQMPDIDGFYIAKELATISPNAYIIFITANDTLAYTAFDFQPFHFICKGNDEKFSQDISRVIKSLAKKIKKYKILTIQMPFDKVENIIVNNIMYIETSSHYLVYHLNHDKEVRVRGKMEDICTKMDEYDFIRTHRRFLVNPEHIRNMDFSEKVILLTDSSTIGIGKNYKGTLLKKYAIYMRHSDV